jgi:mono/diheme cytochrome c family protein
LEQSNKKDRLARTLYVGLLLTVFLIPACSKESRTLGPEQPQTAPNGVGDPRAVYFEGNAYQVSQGGRYFSWYGCSTCHSDGASGARDLSADLKRRRQTFDRTYAFITSHPGVPVRYGDRVPVEQLWQITAYVRSLAETKPELRRRQDLDEAGEPQGANWSGAVR